jgi:CRP-like cAMP-binding protein
MESIPTVQKLRRLRLLSESSENLREELATRGILRRHQPSEPIYLQGDEPKAAYMVVSGMANRETTLSEGPVIQHRRALSGDWLGLANAASRLVPYMHSAIAADISEILSFDIPRFAALRANPEFSHYLLQVAAKEQLVDEERRLNNLSSTRSYDKLILFLAGEMDRMQRKGVPMIHLPYINGTQQYFADAIGVSRETVARDFQPLIAAGILERTRGVRPPRYTILQRVDLSNLAASPLRRNALYGNVPGSKTHRRFSDVA